MTKTVMIDLDDTLVSFTETFLQKANCIISRQPMFREERIDISEVCEYDIFSAFLKHWEGVNQNYIRQLYDYCSKKIFDDITLYDDIPLTKDNYKIMNLVYQFKRNGYKIVLNTKVVSGNMLCAKSKYISDNMKDFEIFDNIILDYETGDIEPKAYYYDIMIDDSPKNIENYLEKNPEGIVYLPIRKWNKHLIGKERIIPIE